MNIQKELLKEIETYEDKASVDTVQDALIVLGVYVSNIDPDQHQEDVQIITDLAQNQPEFIELSEDRETTEKRINFYIHKLLDPVNTEQIVDQAIHSIPPEMKQRACEWLERICHKSGLTEAKMKKLNEIEAKLR